MELFTYEFKLKIQIRSPKSMYFIYFAKAIEKYPQKVMKKCARFIIQEIPPNMQSLPRTFFAKLLEKLYKNRSGNIFTIFSELFWIVLNQLQEIFLTFPPKSLFKKELQANTLTNRENIRVYIEKFYR